MAQTGASGTSIGRLRLRSGGRDTLGASLCAEAMLATVDLQPPALSPTAVLLIRTLRDPLPGSISLRRFAAVPPRWQAAVTGALDQAAQRAVRPALGAVPAGAEAVLFADRAELLACLAHDWLAGVAAARWWWQALFNRQDLHRAVSRAWSESPEFVPAMFERLAREGVAVGFVQALDAPVAEAMLEALVLAHGLGSLRAALVRAKRPAGAAASLSGNGGRERDIDQAPAITMARAGATTSPVPVPPAPAPPLIAHRVPEAFASPLSFRQRALLAVALSLARAPAEARSTGFAVAIALWLRAVDEADTSGPQVRRAARGEPGWAWQPQAANQGAADAGEGPSATGKSVTVAAFRSAPHSEAVLPRLDAGQEDSAAPPSPLASHDSTGLRRAPHDAVAPTAPPPITLTNLAPVTIQPSALVPAGDQARSPVPIDSAFVADSAAVASPFDDAQTTAFEGRVVATEFGGLFCLINAALALGLYGDFTMPAERGIDLSPWDFLALAGEHLAGAEFRGDPAWPLLAQLAGRTEGEAPGAHFAPPPEWRMPAAWLTPFADWRGLWRRQNDAARLRVLHPAGFVLVDVTRDGSPVEEQIHQELRPYREELRFRLRARGEQPPAEDVSPFDRWCGWLLPYLGRRLALAMGLRNVRRAARLLLRQPARIEVSAARVDIHLRLADLPISVRLAGLDRDPGWVPAAGRFLAFHYD
ncbi:MAG: hypothetical protein AW08_01529 [Candidatus Accumulibacter adjunctus]|uniref:Uncharacterized protein n=1 Tax=Candidatus Accumulibacter adjunctus TaxID=1454001 RepID=A0A011NTR6_9PROT|nr:MAG: hypothetical protein AW08_01529 [Candidatus Accumulibacter adjunctus]